MRPCTTGRPANPRVPRIAFYLWNFPGGGLEQVTLTLIQAFVAQGYQVDLVLEHRSGAYLALLPVQVRCVALESGSKWEACRRLLLCWPGEGLRLAARMIWRSADHIPLARLLSLARYMEQERPDVLFASAGRSPFVALWAKRIARDACRVVIAEHSTFSARLKAARHDQHAYRRKRYRKELIGRLYSRADALVAVSTGVADDLVKTANVSRDAIEVIHNPVVTAELLSAAEHTPQHEWFLDPDIDVVLAAGRLAPEKQFEQLIAAFAELCSDRPEFRLLIVGEGPERDRLTRCVHELQLEQRVSMPGWVDNPYALMRHSRLFVLCSRFEGLPVALIEALACGCPVVATDCPSGPREILDDGRYGQLVPVGDVPALAAAISLELDNPHAPEELQARSQYFSEERAVTAYQALIKRLSRERLSNRAET